MFCLEEDDKMRHNWSIILIVIGIICICLSVFNLSYARASVAGIVIILLGLAGLGLKTSGIEEAKKFNYRETDSADNCLKCKYCNMKSYDGYEADCNSFKMKIDEDHVCDILGFSKSIKNKY